MSFSPKKSKGAAFLPSMNVANGLTATMVATGAVRKAFTAAAFRALVAIAVNVGFFYGALSMIGNQWAAFNVEYNTNNIMNSMSTAGVAVWFIGIAAGPISIGLAMLAAGYARQAAAAADAPEPEIAAANRKRANIVYSIYGVGVAAATTWFCYYCWFTLINASQTFNTHNAPDGLKQFLGGMGLAVYTPVSVMVVAMTATQARWFTRGPVEAAFAGNKGYSRLQQEWKAAGYEAEPTFEGVKGCCGRSIGARAHQGDGMLRNLPGLALMLVVLAAAILGSMLLTPVWCFQATSYFQSQAIDNGITYTLLSPTLQWVWGDVPSAADALNGWIQPAAYLKLYEDIVVYFSVIIGLALLAFTSLRIPFLRRMLHTRVGDLFCASCWRGRSHEVAKATPSWNLALRSIRFSVHWLADLCVGEAFVLATISGLYCYWFWFWSTGYPRIRQEVQSYNDNYEDVQVYSRVMGHMTTLTMSFLTFPVARNSVWESAYGIPFERAIKHHRSLGRLAWLFVTIHMVLFQIKWYLEGKIWQNVFAINNLEVTPCINTGSPCVQPGPNGPVISSNVHLDNFTIPIVEAAWLILTLALIAANFMRRWNYEVFHVTHHAVMLFFIAGLLHAWSHWYYTAGGLVLYLFEKATRTIKASRPVTLTHLSHAAGVTKMTVSADCVSGAGGCTPPFAGQYAFICVPDISSIEWHPITIASPPQQAVDKGTITFYIKDMGEGTWTNKLAMLAAGAAAAGSDGIHPPQPLLAKIPVSIDGAYGRAGDYADRETLIFVAGGIGITPLHSILSDLYLRATQPERYGDVGSIRKAHLIWVVRDETLPAVFAETLVQLRSGGPGKMFTVSIFCTGNSSSNSGKKAKKGSKKSINSLGEDAESGTVGLLSDQDGSADAAGAVGGSAAGQVGLSTAVEAGWVDHGSAAAVNGIIQHGKRPNLQTIFDNILSETRQRNRIEEGSSQPMRHLVTTLVCGPAAMVAEASALSHENKLDFHAETFHF